MNAPKNAPVARKIDVRADAADYAAFILANLAARGIDGNELSFAEIVETTFESPKVGLGISAFRNSPERKAAKAAREAAKVEAEAKAEAERKAKAKARAIKNLDANLRGAVVAGILTEAEAAERKAKVLAELDANSESE